MDFVQPYLTVDCVKKNDNDIRVEFNWFSETDVTEN